ncbi:PaaI family thioesterase [Glutamicibacter sp.]|uniref:PaaI family thioesterase n=1 Tax=Glutamicibacter sp. TaxID=1931995 RepID=UPI002B48E935|nr:PaaI family thioesterase [Glutamicibacter sp.]HJX78454.1 PaaI family thioesterase [Glutamicibacter sp.]
MTDTDDLASFKYNSQLLKGKLLNANEELMPEMTRTEPSEFVAATGFVVDELNATSLRGHVQLGTNHHTPWGVVHGGLFTTIVESAAGIGASFAVKEYGQFAVGVHNATDFLRPGSSGLALVEATALHQGRTQQLWEVIITDDASSKVLARGQLRLQNVSLPEKTVTQG